MNKKIVSVLTAGILAVSGLMAQTADDIINKSIEARGGLEKLKALQSVVMDGNLNQAGNDITIKITVVNNKASKVEYSVMGQTGYTIITTTEGWTFNPFTGATTAEKIPADQLKEAQLQLDLPGPFVDYKTKGTTVEYAGKENIDGKDCFKIKLTRANGKVSTYYLDSNYYIVRTVGTAIINGSEMEVTTDYADFRKTPEGYVFPYKRMLQQGEMNFDKIEVNTKVDDSIFKPAN